MCMEQHPLSSSGGVWNALSRSLEQVFLDMLHLKLNILECVWSLMTFSLSLLQVLSLTLPPHQYEVSSLNSIRACCGSFSPSPSEVFALLPVVIFAPWNKVAQFFEGVQNSFRVKTELTHLITSGVSGSFIHSFIHSRNIYYYLLCIRHCSRH